MAVVRNCLLSLNKLSTLILVVTISSVKISLLLALVSSAQAGHGFQ